MPNYCFMAPSLFDPKATAVGSGTELHDAPGAGEQLARLKPCAEWLVEQMNAKGVRANGPSVDEGGWTISVDGKDGFALIVLDLGTSEGQPFQVVLAEIGSAKREVTKVDEALRSILTSSPKISSLAVEV